MIQLQYPFTPEAIRKLKVGDMVLITGKLFTGRDAVHKHLHEGKPCPVNLKNQIIYHCGPVVMKDKKGKWTVTAAGPTTSIREEPYQWEVIRDHGLLGVIGKGGMGAKTLEACQKYGAVYFHAVGGAAQVLAEKVKSVDGLYLEEYGKPEAIWELTVEGFPVVVTMDSHGQSLHKDVEEKSKKALAEVLK
jgi:tartrate/fumarate subfamily iron-sulfur-dependent hydro-lyase beta chain